jgi:hypothetical protein
VGEEKADREREEGHGRGERHITGYMTRLSSCLCCLCLVRRDGEDS